MADRREESRWRYSVGWSIGIADKDSSKRGRSSGLHAVRWLDNHGFSGSRPHGRVRYNSTVQSTVDLYGHVRPGPNRGAVNRLAEATRPGTPVVELHSDYTLRSGGEDRIIGE